MRKDFCYVYSGDLKVPVRLRIVSLYGHPNRHQLSGSAYVSVQIYCNDGKRAYGRELMTSYRPFTLAPGPNRDLQKWDEWLTLPVCYAELSRDATLRLALWEIGESADPILVAYCDKRLFSKHGIFRSGQLDLCLEEVSKSEGLPSIGATRAVPPTGGKAGHYLKDVLKKEKLYKERFIPRVAWLDRITFSRLEELKQQAKTEDHCLYLTIEFPTVYHCDDAIPHAIVFFVAEDDEKGQPNEKSDGPKLTVNADPELNLENLYEAKHHQMTRNERTNITDKRLQPNPSAKSSLEAIIHVNSAQLPATHNGGTGPYLAVSILVEVEPTSAYEIHQDEEIEVKQAIQTIMEWDDDHGEANGQDALELLGPSFTHPFLRRYAVAKLQKTSFSNLLHFLPQLVQALRYEANVNSSDLLIVTKRVKSHATDGEIDESSIDVTTRSTRPDREEFGMAAECRGYFGPELSLSTFLIRIACENTTIANFLYWYLKVETEANAELNHPIAEMFTEVFERLKRALATANSSSKLTLSNLHAQKFKKFVDTLVELAKSVAETSGSRAKKLELLKKRIAESHELQDLKGLSLPLDPTIHVRGINAECTHLFSSNLMPMRITFSTIRGSVVPYECGEAYTTIFKRGDDLRQDQLVIQMIRVMDSLLKEDKLDLCLTPYAVLATSLNEGFVQFVKATPIADIKSIQETLRTYRPSSSGPYGIEADVINNYVRSCAGYCVICYILGVGDRHLHNLLLCENGRMFHVDFGFILGRDPKPLPPPMKLTTEMVNAMGGQSSEHFKCFIDYSTTAFCILRRYANLITNLFGLMLDAGIPDIAIEKDKAVQKVLERFHLELNDEMACRYMNNLIESSISAKMPVLVDLIHDVKQFLS